MALPPVSCTRRAALAALGQPVITDVLGGQFEVLSVHAGPALTEHIRAAGIQAE